MPGPIGKTLIVLEFALCFAPIFAYLAVGVLFLPIQLAILVRQPLSVDALVPAMTLLGMIGTWALYHILNWIIAGKRGPSRAISVYLGLTAGLLALIPLTAEFAPELRFFAALAFLATCHFMWLGRDYEQAREPAIEAK